jgi:hypothetical protein
MARAVPAVQPEAKFADPSPLMQPVPIAVTSNAPANGRRLLAASGAGLVAMAAAVGVIAFGWTVRLPRFRTGSRAILRGAA